MLHSPAYSTDVHSFGGASLARIDIGAGVSFSSTARNHSTSSVCICAGYITDIPHWRDKILRESHGSVTARSPADIISYLLSTCGPSGFDQLNGTFVFAHWDNTARTLRLGGDRLGMQPLYICRRGQRLKFASEPKAIILTESGLQLDHRSIEDMVVLSTITGDRTMYREIERLPIATILTIDARGEQKHRYWWFDRLKIDESMTVPDFISESETALRSSVNRLTPLCDQMICTLSSGNDSRRVFMELINSGRSFSVYTAAVPLKGSLWECDSVISKSLCDEYGIDQHRTDFYDPDLESELASAAFALLDHETDQHRWAIPLVHDIPLNCGVNFDGFGGDIYVYDTSLVAHLLGNRADNRTIAQHLISFNYGSHERQFLRPTGAESVEDRHTSCLEQFPQDDNRNTTWFSALWARRRTAPFARMLMNLKVESVFPYLDNEVVDVSMKLSPKLKVGRDLQFEILQHQYPDLMRRFPTSGYPGINSAPDEFARRFVTPIPSGFYEKRTRGYYRTVAKQVLGSPRLRGLVSRPALLSALAVSSVGWTGYLPPPIEKSAWRLRPLGLVADLVLTLGNQSLAREQLNHARQIVFGR